MPPAKNTEPTVFQAVQSFSTTIGKRAYHVQEGERVAAGHELLDALPELFKPMTIHYPAVETATATPGKKRGSEA